MPQHRHLFRVRYGETDQMGTFYNARALDWFEVGRTELSRSAGMPYAEWEKRGVFLPVIEAHVYFLGRARYDDLLEMTTSMELDGKARIRFAVAIRQANGSGDVASGHTVHALVNGDGKPIRPPDWVVALMDAKDTA